MRRTLNRYIARRILYGLMTAFFIVTAIIILVDFVEGTRKFSDVDSMNAVQIFGITLLKIPQILEETLPFIVLFGVIATLFNLNRRSELIVMRASGVSAWRFLSPVFLITSSLGLIWVSLFNPLAEHTHNLHTQYVQTHLGDKTEASDQDVIWLRAGFETGQTVIRGQNFNILDKTISHATFWIFDIQPGQQSRFSYRLDAQHAHWSPGYWQLENVVENSAKGIKRDIAFVSLPTNLRLQDFDRALSKQRLPGFWQLPDEIKRLQHAGFSSHRLTLEWHSLLALPVMLVAMSFIAAAATLHLSREGGTLKLMIFGGLIGFGVFFANSVLKAFGETGALNPALAAWTVPVLALLYGISYLAKREDG